MSAGQYREMDAMIDGFALRFEGAAAAIINAESRNAAEAYEGGGTGAAVAVVDERVWEAYIKRLWFAVAPEAGAMVNGWLEPEGKALAKPDLLALVRQQLEQFAPRKAGELAATSRESIRAAIEADQTPTKITAQRIARTVKAAAPQRAKRISYSEAHESANGGSMTAARNLRRAYDKVWTATMDGRVRDAHSAAHRQRRKIDDSFLVMGESLRFPGDSEHGSPANICNCRCNLTYSARVRV